MRVDKTLSELWHLRGSDNQEASDTAFMAINTIKKLQKEIEALKNENEQLKKDKKMYANIATADFKPACKDHPYGKPSTNGKLMI